MRVKMIARTDGNGTSNADLLTNSTRRDKPRGKIYERPACLPQSRRQLIINIFNNTAAAARSEPKGK